jgi:hypothetical protein
MKSNYRQGKVPSMMAMLLTMLAVVMLGWAAVPAHAQTPTTLHGFQNASTDACEPEDNIVQGRDGNMYGVGVGCGTNGTGAVYKISPAGAESVVFNFPSNWSFCFSGLTLGSDGNFYGTEAWGLNPVPLGLSILHVSKHRTNTVTIRSSKSFNLPSSESADARRQINFYTLRARTSKSSIVRKNNVATVLADQSPLGNNRH